MKFLRFIKIYEYLNYYIKDYVNFKFINLLIHLNL
jgi:hypothetical protein